MISRRSSPWCRRFALSAGCAALGLALRAAEPAAAWQTGTGHRWQALAAATGGVPGFTLLPPATTGVVFTNTLAEADGAANRVLYNGSGVAAGDYDGDGRPDLFFCSLAGANRLFRNLGGARFEDATAAAGLATPLPGSRGAVFADLNADRHPDLLVSVNGQGVCCFLNDGRGRFTDTTAAAGTGSRTGSTTLALADVDGNGTPDLYVANYRPDDVRDRGRATFTVVNGRPLLAGTETNRFILLNGQLQECGQPDQLFLNDGTGRFRAVPWTDGTFADEAGVPLKEPPLDWGLSAAFRDVNGDLAPDLYVCNDYWTPDRFWLNDGRGRFRAAPRAALRQTSASSMGVDFADVDRDGHVDFVVLDMLSRDPVLRKRQGLAQMPPPVVTGAAVGRPQVLRNTLFRNRGDGTFAEIAYFAGLEATDWSWAALFTDVDLDGYEDLLVGAGHFRDVQDLDAEQVIRGRQRTWESFRNDAERQAAYTRELMEHHRLYPPLDLPIGAFRNRGDLTFEEVTAGWGLDHRGVHHGMAVADLDGDGGPDLVVNTLNGPARLFRHAGAAGRVAVRLRGQAPNTQGLGAQVTLRGGAVPVQTAEMAAGGRYQSGSDMELVFATGRATNGLTLEVRWRNGARGVITNVMAGCRYEVDEEDALPAPPPATMRPPIFVDDSASLAARHTAAPFDEFARQPLLPFRRGPAGPGVAWPDLDGDGHEDLVLAGGRGTNVVLRHGDGRGGFTPWPDATARPAEGITPLGWTDRNGARHVLLGLSGYGSAAGPAAWSRSVVEGRLAEPVALAPDMVGGGGLALGDPEGDGRLALFIAGGVRPGQYPLGGPSRLFRHDGAQWVADARSAVLLENLGIVNAALWTDLDGDGRAELVLACEWGPIRAFRVQRGALAEATPEFGLAAHTGWWRGVAAGDFNNDGRLDLVASNWGLNSPYRATPERPLTFAFGQLAQPGVTDVVEAEHTTAGLAPRRPVTALAASLPFLLDTFASHRAYSEATLDEVLGDRRPLSRRVAVTTLASTLFLNTGRGFQAVPLPAEAQFAPAFGVAVADFDGDGNEDVFLAQNFFGTPSETGRLDAGEGLWLAGDGTGRLMIPVPAARSGVRVPGEQRGAAVADFNGDGRVDLAVTQAGDALKLFRNVGAAPGLRVRLHGTAGNPDALGAVLRLEFTGRPGPARELHGGAGFASQDGLVQVFGTPLPPTALRVRWPGGRETTTPVPAGAKEITVGNDGAVTASR